MGGPQGPLLPPHPAPQGRTPPVTSPRWDLRAGAAQQRRGSEGDFGGLLEVWGGSGNPWAPSQPVPPPLPQVAGWEAQKKEQPMFGEEQHVRYGTRGTPTPRRTPPGHLLFSPGSAAIPCPGGHPGGPESLPGYPERPMCQLGPPNSLDTPSPSWTPQDFCVRAPQCPTDTPVLSWVPWSPTDTPCPLWAPQELHVPRVPRSPMSPVESPRSPCHPDTPDSRRVSQGPSSPRPRRRPVARGGAIGTAAPWGGR